MRIKALFLRNPNVDVRRAIDETDTFAETRTKLRHSREVTRVCSPEPTHWHACGADDNASNLIDLGAGTLNFWWVTLTEQKWVTIRERRGTKEPDHFQIHKIHFLQIEDNRGPGSLDLSR